jgi:hypothetical protein
MSIEKIQEYIAQLCPTFVAVPEDMLCAFIDLTHYCMRHPDLLVGQMGLKEQLTLKALQFTIMKHDHVRFIKPETVDRVVAAARAYLYFVHNVV